MKKGVCCGITALIVLLSGQVIAQEGGKISLGNLKVIPAVTIQSVYDDNIYSKNGKDESANKKVSDIINHIKPSLGLNFTLPQRMNASLMYQGDWAFYRDDRDNNWKNNSATLNMDYKAPGGIIAGLKETYQHAEDPYGAPNLYAVGRVSKRWSNGLDAKVGYSLEDTYQAMVYFSNYKQQYVNDQDYSQDYTDNEVGLGLQAKFLPKTWGFARYYFGKRDYDSYREGVTSDNDADNRWHRVNVGLTWDQGAKLGGEFNVGYQWKKYEHQTNLSGLRYEDKNTWVAATALNYQATTTTFIALSVSRAIRESGSNTTEYFADTGIGLSAKQKLFEKFSATAGVSYSRNEFNTKAKDYAGVDLAEERKDDNYNANLGLDYAIQDWLGAGVGYNYKRKSSNAVNNEYTDNQYFLQLRLIY